MTTTRRGHLKQRAFLVLSVLQLSTAALLLTGCERTNTTAAEGQKTLYTCGMHPQVVQDHPGNCSICGMKLTPIRKQATNTGTESKGAENAAVSESQTIAIDPVTTQNMGIRTAVITRGPLRRLIRTVGVIDYNETA